LKREIKEKGIKFIDVSKDDIWTMKYKKFYVYVSLINSFKLL
jgi:hypothetical protein